MGIHLNQLCISNLRNLSTVELQLSNQFNVFIGENGSGKTSLLEAIYLLGHGRSFRARSMQKVIAFGSKSCVIRANMSSEQNNTWLAMERGIDGYAQYKVGSQEERTAAALSKFLPLQLIDVNSHVLLEGGPNNRRQFIDWGVFHMEHTFIDSWRAMQRALLQRNAVLKSRKAPPKAWNDAFVQYSEAVDSSRAAYILKFTQVFLTLIDQMLGITGIEIKYNRGWKADMSLDELLLSTLEHDLQYGYTAAGPHRAELQVLIDGKPAKDVLSRGQMKIFVCIMLLARAKLLSPEQKGIFLVDDLHAELDTNSCDLLIQAIKAMDCQVFITGIDAAALLARIDSPNRGVFHVERGLITSAV